jgi:hypothetical protein
MPANVAAKPALYTLYHRAKHIAEVAVNAADNRLGGWLA